MTNLKIPAVYMRGGTSKGVFLHAKDIPAERAERDRLLLRLLGSPDPYGRQMDGMGGATSSTSKVVLISPSARPDCDVDYLFGQVGVEDNVIDWSGNCGNLSAAVAPFAVSEGLVTALEGSTAVRIWQANLKQRIVAHVPVRGGEVLEQGAFREDGVPFAGAEVRLEFLDDSLAKVLPTGRPQDLLSVPDVGELRVSLIQAGNPTVFVRADAVGLTGKESPEAVNRDSRLLARLEAVRVHAAVAMGLAASPQEATLRRPATPKIAWVAKPAGYRASGGRDVGREEIDVLARILSMGKLHHAFTGTGSIALAVAAALPGTVVSEVARTLPGVPTRIGHAAGVMAVGATVREEGRKWVMEKAVLSRSARRLMSGWVYVPRPH
jgi:probable AcnD-accessory protein PrpF